MIQICVPCRFALNKKGKRRKNKKKRFVCVCVCVCVCLSVCLSVCVSWPGTVRFKDFNLNSLMTISLQLHCTVVICKYSVQYIALFILESQLFCIRKEKLASNRKGSYSPQPRSSSEQNNKPCWMP